VETSNLTTHVIAVLNANPISNWTRRTSRSRGNGVNIYSGGVPFEFRKGKRLLWLRSFAIFTSLSMEIYIGHNRFLPDYFEFIDHPIIRDWIAPVMRFPWARRYHNGWGFLYRLKQKNTINTKQAPWFLVWKRTITTERPSRPAKLVQTFVGRNCVVTKLIPTAVILGFIGRCRYFVTQVAPYFPLRGWVEPVPDQPLLRKSDKAGNRTRDLWICSQELWPLDSRGGQREDKYYNARFEISAAVNMKNAVFWDVTPCGSSKKRYLKGTYRFHHQGDKNQWARNNIRTN
jgi:hypothetical protein